MELVNFGLDGWNKTSQAALYRDRNGNNLELQR